MLLWVKAHECVLKQPTFRFSSGLLKRIETKMKGRYLDGKLRVLEQQFDDNANSTMDFSSNDYLGLSRSRPLSQNIKTSYDSIVRSLPLHFPIQGSTGSRLLTGHNAVFKSTEDFIAKFHGQPFSLVANSGWDLNFGLLSAISDSHTTVVYDELSHNSLIMGIRNSRRKAIVSFKHNDLASLEAALVRIRRGGKHTAVPRNHSSFQHHQTTAAATPTLQEILIVVEGLYSMDGDVCPLTNLLDLAHAYDALVIVDEAHSTGIYGARGEGLVGALGLGSHPSLLGVIHTFGKALGVHGAALVTPHRDLISYLVNYSRPLIYSTSLPLHSLVCIQEAYKIMSEAQDLRDHLFRLIEGFTTECNALGIDAIPSESPIQGVIIPGNQRVLSASAYLREGGFHCLPIRAPTVPEGLERLRIVLHAHNTQEEVRALCLRLAHFLRQSGD